MTELSGSYILPRIFSNRNLIPHQQISIVLIEDTLGPKFGMRLVGRMSREVWSKTLIITTMIRTILKINIKFQNPESIVIPDDDAVQLSFEAQNKLWDQDLTDFYGRCIHAIQNYAPDYSFENGGCSVRDLEESVSGIERGGGDAGGSEMRGGFDFGRF
jgi:hypothetical protein